MHLLGLSPKQHVHLLIGVVAEDSQSEEVSGRALSGVKHRGSVLPWRRIKLFTVTGFHQQLVPQGVIIDVVTFFAKREGERI